ncbi:tRNA pseudouridine synthase 1 [Kappamyces sp. JEL0680]|nr:tRNA pseudouridine synthase 1 [Kappamyces sp. JEL0680]
MNSKETIAVLLAYNGSRYDGLERVKHKDSLSIEACLFKAFPASTISLTHISRASLTAPGEHAAKQVISLSFSGPTVPTADQLNAALATQDIRVFKVLKTYAFAPPPEATHYCNPEIDDHGTTLEDAAYPDMPKGGLFEDARQKHASMQRRQTFLRQPTVGADEINQVYDDAIDASALAAKERMAKKVLVPQEKKKGFSLFMENFVAMFKPKKQGSEILKKSLEGTLRRKSTSNVEDSPEKDEPLTATLRRSMSQKRTLQSVLDQDILEEDGKELVFDPLNIPPPSPREIAAIRSYRMSAKQYSTLTSTLALFNGTHNFHNYIPGSVQDDSRCFVNIFNIEASPLELHSGMEWVRVKVQASAFARDQIRKMIGMLIMVTRTNTPRSVLGNSFGYSKIDIPETPVGFQILDEPHYNNYNADAVKQGKQVIRFGDVDEQVQAFRNGLYTDIFSKEQEQLVFEAWLRQLDNYSFMYSHYLNARGVIGKQRSAPRVAPVEE